MSIMKTKIKIFLVGIILYQGALLMHKQDNGYILPDISTVKASYGITSPAYANDNTGIPLDIPYSPYIGEPSSHYSQMQAAELAEKVKNNPNLYMNDNLNQALAAEIAKLQ